MKEEFSFALQEVDNFISGSNRGPKLRMDVKEWLQQCKIKYKLVDYNKTRHKLPKVILSEHEINTLSHIERGFLRWEREQEIYEDAVNKHKVLLFFKKSDAMMFKMRWL